MSAVIFTLPCCNSHTTRLKFLLYRNRFPTLHQPSGGWESGFLELLSSKSFDLISYPIFNLEIVLSTRLRIRQYIRRIADFYSRDINLIRFFPWQPFLSLQLVRMALNALLLRRSLNNILRAEDVDAKRLIKPGSFLSPHILPRLWPWPQLRPVRPCFPPTGTIHMVSKPSRVREVDVTQRAVRFDMHGRVPPVLLKVVYSVGPEATWAEVPFIFVVRGTVPWYQACEGLVFLAELTVFACVIGQTVAMEFVFGFEVRGGAAEDAHEVLGGVPFVVD